MAAVPGLVLRACLVLAAATLVLANTGEVADLSHGEGEEPLASDSEELLGDTDTIIAFEDHAALEYAMFKAVQGGTLVDKADHFLRHMGDTGEITTVASDEDKRDVTWRIKPALCKPGVGKCPNALEGNPRCVSLESANWAGHYLMHKKQRLVVAKQTMDTWAQATFCIRPGLADKSKISFESLDSKEHFIRHNFFHLYICDNTNKGGCGRTSLEKFRRDSTFEQKQPEFFGLCEGPEKPEKCRCAAGRTGPKCKQQCPGLQNAGQASCSGHGACFFDSNAQKAGCRCEPGFVGTGCDEKCPQGLNKEICGKNGQCEADETGKAICKCTASWKGHTCEHRCPGSKDGKVCSGSGKCSYDEQEKVTFCKCDEGFLGKNCAVSCAKDNRGRVCSGNGLCAADGEDKAKCVCKKGFLGSDCSLKCKRDVLGRVCGGDKQGTCMTDNKGGNTVCKCKKGFLGPDCNVKCPGVDPKKAGSVCNGQGTCFLDSKTNKAKCVCSKGFTGDDCSNKCPSSENGDVCNGHGKCSTNGDKAQCKCSGGFVGDACEHNCPGSSQSQGQVGCNGHGACSLENNKAVCKCAAGYMGEGCSLSCPRHNGASCGGEGECYADKGIAKCKCKQGFLGLKCEAQCPGRTNDSVCGGHGKCMLAAGGQAKCVCDPGYGGRACGQSCPITKDAKTGKTQVCFGKGECMPKGGGMQCVCKKGWMGEGCSIPCPTSISGEICSKRGMCLLSESGDKAKCQCKDGFVGRACAQVCPTADDGSICSGHGKCRAHGNTAVCKCHKDFTGGTCSKGCPKDASGTICNGNGKCVLKDNVAQCECHVGHTGKDCETRICATENSLFDAKTSRCLCEPGYTCCSAKKLKMLMESDEADEATVRSGLEEFE